MKKCAILLISLLFLTTLQAQNGYDIWVSIENVPDKMLYLAGFYGDEAMLYDSAKVKKNHLFRFKTAKKELPSGIYWLLNKDKKVYMELLIDQNRHFKVETSMECLPSGSIMTNSDENRLFFSFRQRAVQGEDRVALVQEYVERSPQSLLAKYLSAQHAVDRVVAEDTATWLRSSDLPDYYFEHVDLTDARLLRTPLSHDVFDTYFRYVAAAYPGELTSRIDSFLARTGSCKETRNFYLRRLYHLFNDDTPIGNVALVHLFDTYCPAGQCEWLESPSHARIFKRMVERKRRLLPGAIVPPLEAYDVDGKLLKTKDIAADYVVLWFWDPDCDDCVEETPKLFDFYKKNRDTYHFEVYAVSITEDVERWQNFIEKNQVHWLNASYGKGEPNYDFADYFDVLTTPGIFLMRKDHTLVASQFPLEDLQIYLLNDILQNEKQ